MGKSKVIAIAAAAALVAMLGLSACGGQPASSSASSASSSSSAAKSSSSSASASSSASSSSAASSASAETVVISWQGALADGTLVDYINSDDAKNGGLVLTKPQSAEPMRWLGALTATQDGKITITDDNSKEAVSFTLTGVNRDGVVTIDVEGYGKGALVPMTAADWKRVAEAEEVAKTLGTVVNTVGTFEDGTVIAYTEDKKGDNAVVAVWPKNSTQVKTWAGKATTAEDGKETVTDEKTQETFSYTWTENPDNGTITIDADGYGKAVLVKMTVADWVTLDELSKR